MFTPETLIKFDLTFKNIVSENETTVWVKKWNWEYDKALAFQRFAVELLSQHPKKKILIMTNHPHVFTNGRGLQKARKGQTLNLVDFKPELASSLPFLFFQIERGGGLTFHHPGQFVFYPVLKLNPERLSLSSMIDDIFDFSKNILDSWGVEGLTTENALLGLWKGDRKLASMGIAIEKLTTFHGMALNIHRDEKMEKAIRALNPCGISAETYTSVEEMITLPPDALEKFSSEFMERINHGWK